MIFIGLFILALIGIMIIPDTAALAVVILVLVCIALVKLVKG